MGETGGRVGEGGSFWGGILVFIDIGAIMRQRDGGDVQDVGDAPLEAKGLTCSLGEGACRGYRSASSETGSKS